MMLALLVVRCCLAVLVIGVSFVVLVAASVIGLALLWIAAGVEDL